MAEEKKLIIIGSGPAGLTAGIYAARANLDPVIIEGKNPGGQLISTTLVENWPGEKSVMGPKLMANIKEQALALGCTFLPGSVTAVDFSKPPFLLKTEKGDLYTQTTILACGATPKKLKVPGEDTYWGKGVTTCAICDGAFYPDKEVIIVGGGDTAMEDALFMSKFTQKITIVQILDSLSASHAMKERVLKKPTINILYNSTVSEIKGDGEKITGVTITNKKDNSTTSLPAAAVFIAIGFRPNTGFLEEQVQLTDYGHVALFNEHFKTGTSVKGVFAAGDIADPRYRQAVTSAGTGCMAALDAENYLSSLTI